MLLEQGALVRFNEHDIQQSVGAVGGGRKIEVRTGGAEVEHFDEQVFARQAAIVELDLARDAVRPAKHPVHYAERRADSGFAAAQLVDVA